MHKFYFVLYQLLLYAAYIVQNSTLFIVFSLSLYFCHDRWRYRDNKGGACALGLAL